MQTNDETGTNIQVSLPLPAGNTTMLYVKKIPGKHNRPYLLFPAIDFIPDDNSPQVVFLVKYFC
jgi:hypothetical protein